MRHLPIIFLLLTGCKDFWIAPGQAPWRDECGISDYYNNARYREFWGNNIDDTCDGLIDPGNGSNYVEIHNDADTSTYLEFYNYQQPDVLGIPVFLHPQQTWETTLLWITSFDEATDEWVYLYGNDNSSLGYRIQNEQLEIIYEFRLEGAVQQIIQRLEQPLILNTMLTIQYVFDDEPETCNFAQGSLNIFLNNQRIPATQSMTDEDMEVDCAFEADSTVTFGGRAALPSGFVPFNGAVDELIIAQRQLSDDEREELMAEVLAPRFDNNAFQIVHDFTGFEDLMWQTIDLSNGSCDIGFLDDNTAFYLRYITEPCTVRENTIDVDHMDDSRIDL